MKLESRPTDLRALDFCLSFTGKKKKIIESDKLSKNSHENAKDLD